AAASENRGCQTVHTVASSGAVSGGVSMPAGGTSSSAVLGMAAAAAPLQLSVTGVKVVMFVGKSLHAGRAPWAIRTPARDTIVRALLENWMHHVRAVEKP